LLAEPQRQASTPRDIFIVYHQIRQNASKYFQTKGSFSGCLFLFAISKNKQRTRAYLTKSPKNCKQAIKLFLNFYKQG
jgi:hypothetical protein